MTIVDCEGCLWKEDKNLRIQGLFVITYSRVTDVPIFRPSSHIKFGNDYQFLMEDGRIYDIRDKSITIPKHPIINIVTANYNTYQLNDRSELYKNDKLIRKNVKFIGLLNQDAVVMIINNHWTHLNRNQLDSIGGDLPTGGVLGCRECIVRTTDGYWFMHYHGPITSFKFEVPDLTIDVVAYYQRHSSSHPTTMTLAALTSEGRLFQARDCANFQENTNLAISMLHSINPWKSLYTLHESLQLCNSSGVSFKLTPGLESLNNYPTEMFKPHIE